MTTKRMAAVPAMLEMLAGLWMLPGRPSPAALGRTAKSMQLATSMALAGLAVLGLAACGGGSDDGPARTYQSVALPMDLTLDQLTDEQQANFCSWINDPSNQPASDPTQAGTSPAVVDACLAAFATYPLCTVGQYDACARARFANPDGATPDACKAIASCPVTPRPQFDIAPPSRVCSGVMMPGSARWCDVDGTAQDMTTGLHWLKDANCPDSLGFYLSIGWVFDPELNVWWLNVMSFPAAFDWASALSTGHCGLLDGSSAGPWHLPTIDQFLALRQGVEAVSTASPRLFPAVFHFLGRTQFWTSSPAILVEGRPAGLWMYAILDPAWSYDPYWNGSEISEKHLRLPVRGPLSVTAATGIAPGKSYSLAPSAALNPVAGTSYFTRSYLTVPVWLPAPVHVALSSWDNAERRPRIFFFDADTADPTYFRIWYPHGSGVRFYLQVEGNSINPGAAVVGWPDAGGNNRLWKPEFVDGGAMLKSKLSGLCMHIETNDGLFLRQAPCDATNKAQVFVLTPRQGG